MKTSILIFVLILIVLFIILSVGYFDKNDDIDTSITCGDGLLRRTFSVSEITALQDETGRQFVQDKDGHIIHDGTDTFWDFFDENPDNLKYLCSCITGEPFKHNLEKYTRTSGSLPALNTCSEHHGIVNSLCGNDLNENIRTENSDLEQLQLSCCSTLSLCNSDWWSSQFSALPENQANALRASGLNEENGHSIWTQQICPLECESLNHSREMCNGENNTKRWAADGWAYCIMQDYGDGVCEPPTYRDPDAEGKGWNYAYGPFTCMPFTLKFVNTPVPDPINTPERPAITLRNGFYSDENGILRSNWGTLNQCGEWCAGLSGGERDQIQDVVCAGFTHDSNDADTAAQCVFYQADDIPSIDIITDDVPDPSQSYQKFYKRTM